MNLKVKMLEGEYWYGGSTAEAHYNPFDKNSVYNYNMYEGDNQTMPLFLSTQGRYIWCEKPMVVHIENGVFDLYADSEIILCHNGNCLKDAYLSASQKHFKFSGKVPPLMFFEGAQYNTWMELDYNQNQKSILEYARGIVKNGYEPGVLMIDEGWHTRYGTWEWDFSKFPDPRAMIEELHSLGFKVMLWVVPLVSADGKDFVMATRPYLSFLEGACGDKELFLRTDDGRVALVEWWNGYSAILNLCKEYDREFLDSKLQKLINEYGVDGFKFDGGNISMYNPNNIINGTQTKFSADELNIAWNDFGTRYEYHEYKDTFKGGGKAVIQRLRDRHHTWSGYGINSILPSALLQGLIGHPFICPDMIGGGEWSFNYMKDFECDGELFVRMAQLSSLFPMMQFSWAPWRVLDSKHANLCLASANLHKAFASYIVKLVKESARSGEPIVRHLEYEYPHCGYERVLDQFLLGSKVLVAPVLEKGQTKRRVVLPVGKWLYAPSGVVYEGGEVVEIEAPLEVLPYFLKQ
ncbi:MAG: glycoside hydrolase [Clostridia bacterium]|nr:glycoside hydrolase [Clostridia bacterium]